MPGGFGNLEAMMTGDIPKVEPGPTSFNLIYVRMFMLICIFFFH